MTLKARLASFVLSAASALAVPAFADVPAKDWPEFHGGPTRDNISRETGLLQEWPKDGPKLARTATGAGDGHASVAVAGGKVFTSGKIGGKVTAVAFDEATGKQVWAKPIGGGVDNIEPQGGKGSRVTPTVDGDTVYYNAPAGEIVALKAADGAQIWQTSLKQFGGEVPAWGFSDALLIDGDHLITIPGGPKKDGKGTVLALNKKTGEKVWQSTGLTVPAHYASPVLATIGGVRQYVVLTEKVVAGIDPKDGAVLWQAPFAGRVAVCTAPVVFNNHVFITAAYGVGCDLIKVTKEGDAFKTTKVYSNKNMVNHHGGVILLDGNLYGYSDGKGWVCMDFMTGKIKWAEKESDVKKGTVSYADGRLYLRDEKTGTIALIEASPTGYKELGHFDPPSKSNKPYWPHLVIANGKLYVRDMDNVFCYDIKK
jgi:outer membrane protein assembly factor BamB